MGKLFEVLAVEKELQKKAEQTRGAAQQVFSKSDRLIGQDRRYLPFGDEGEQLPNESKRLPTTVDDELKIVASDWAAFVDAALQKEVTNTKTNASLTIGTLPFDLPATALLNLEGRIAELKKLFSTIPTVDPAIEWDRNEDLECLVSSERVTYRTAKAPRSFEASPATENHPAQVQVWQEDRQIGEWRTRIYSGAWTEARKRQALDKIDALARSVKQARQRANDIEVQSVSIGALIFDYILQ